MRDGGPHTENHLLCHDCRYLCNTFNLEASNCTLPLRYKAHPPNKGCVIRDKTMRLTDEYAHKIEVRLTSGLYLISLSGCAIINM